MAEREPVGDFYMRIVRGPSDVDDGLTSSTKLLAHDSGDRPSVIHFYNGG